MTTGDKRTIMPHEIVYLERAIHLNLLDDWESEFVLNLSNRFKKYGEKMVITNSQSDSLKLLSDRFKTVWGL